ncbi:short-chain dehydrogenase [Hygrophoropsis aurantiaca]|uniref:Short-chain dehydrogenase n=1 Tax=Hygrophoropsis aurantiaca TaxID=72124 RepID=A0ACB8A4K0_9AGAM|nr:short-chain dehydrogenase [Hygrophoropsis aurantiaca]
MGKFGRIRFFREQWADLPLASGNISDKTIVVTGANVGLGLEASVHLARMKPGKLIVTCRDDEKCERTAQAIEQRISGTNLAAWPLELSTFDSVRAFVDRFESEGEKVDVLIANAALATFNYAKSTDGWETTLQVNCLSTALLSILMLPHLVKTSTPEAPSRLVIVSSEAHYLPDKLKNPHKWPKILDMLNSEKYCIRSIMSQRYYLSKLLELMFVRELCSRLPDPTPVVVCAPNPGFCYSSLARETEANPLHKYGFRLLRRLLARSTEMGSRTLVHPAVAPDERSRHGRYLSAYKVTEESDYMLSDEGKEISRRLWAETIEILGTVDPRVNSIIAEYLSA